MNLGEIEEDISTEEELEKIMGKEVGGDVEEAAEEPEDLLHTSDQNENSGEIRFSCETCEEEFNSVEELRNHVRSHLVESEPGEPNHIHAKNVWCYGEGYFGQKNIAEKVRKLRQNVDRDISA